MNQDIVRSTFKNICHLAQNKNVEVELLIEGRDSFSATYRKSELEKFNSIASAVAGFRVLFQGSTGYAFTEKLESESLLRTYEIAFENAQFLGQGKGKNQGQDKAQDKTYHLVPPGIYEKMDFLFNSDLETHSIEEKLEVAKILESEALAVDARVKTVSYSGFSHSKGWTWILNSQGIDAQYETNGISGYAYSLVKEGEQSKEQGESKWTRHWEELEPKKIAQLSAHRALELLGAKSIPSGTYTVLFENDVAAKLFELVTHYFSAKEVFNKTSWLTGKLNQPLFSSELTLMDDPYYSLGSNSRPFDSEGSPSQKTILIEQGIVSYWLTNSEYAAKMNIHNTSHASRSPTSELSIAPSNLVVKKGPFAFEDLLKKDETIIFINSMKGFHAGVKLATGDFSIQSSGFLYRSGKKVHPIEEIVVSGHLVETFKNIEGLSDRYADSASSVFVPDILVKGVSIAGKG